MVIKNKVRYSASEGQSLVLVALMAIVLVAFVGLAIDGGMAFSQRRAAQNAGDGASIRGAYLMRTGAWRDNFNETAKRNQLLSEIHAMAELHGVPDTNGTPGDHINDNIIAYYRDADGDVPMIPAPGGGTIVCPDDCPVIGTSPIPSSAWGVMLDVELPFDTYFIGVIGWDEITVRATAIAVAHAGPQATNNDQWVLFADNEQSCDTPTNGHYAIDMAGATNTISGNVHSNGNIQVNQTQIHQPFDAEMTFRLGGTCTGCGGAVQHARPEVGIVMPSFDDYFTLVDQQTRITGVGTRYENLPIPPGYTRPTLVFSGTKLGDDGTGNEPYVYIDGDLVIERTDNTIVRLAGMIAVNGNVTIAAPRVQSMPFGASILAKGQIRTLSPNFLFDIKKPYQSNAFDPMLSDNRHVAALWTNVEYSGSDACTIPAIQLQTPGWLVKGAILAPHGLIDMDNNGANKQVNGSVIGDTINLGGGGTILLYNASYFPPQPDIVELME